MKVLDDPANEIRAAGCETVLAYLECFKDRKDIMTYSGHIEEMINGLLIHLDDPVTRVEEAVLVVLKELATIEPNLLKRQVDDARNKHRNVRPLDELLQHIQNLKVK